ncbi:MAG: hypothetical protein IKY02_04305 [Lachnospiraceae bacterium]|nr:hypothetical protein [Lachnospiraceae bacterium]
MKENRLKKQKQLPAEFLAALKRYLAEEYRPDVLTSASVAPDNALAEEAAHFSTLAMFRKPGRKARKPAFLSGNASECEETVAEAVREERVAESVPYTLPEALKNLDESFTEMLLRKIDEKGMKDSECYKKARVDRKLFSKIRSDRLYRPSKQTAVAFAFALELPFEEAESLLKKAGFAFSKSSKADVIAEYFLLQNRYDLDGLNEALLAYDQPLIGC